MRRSGMRARCAAALLGAALLAGVLPLSMAVAEEPGQTGSQTEEVSVEPRAASEVYVSADGSDERGDGSADSPYASLAKAVDEAPDGATIYVMSDLTMTKPARFWDKNLTITSDSDGPHTLTRCDGDFAMSIDTNLGGYNGAMIEVGNSGSLTVRNLILDDNGKAEGTRYVQAAPHRNPNDDPYDPDDDWVGGSTEIDGELVDNADIVQDGVIATYSEGVTITLGEGTRIQNFGGMSAVRVSGGTLVMQHGSEIVDDMEVTRKKGDDSDYGFAGAVWVQSGTFTLDKGASIHDTDGHAVYVDGVGSEVTINGDIRDISTSSQAWQGSNGGALHVRGGAAATINGVISNVSGSGSAVYITGGGTSKSSLSLSEGAVIRDCGNNVAGIQVFGNNGIKVSVDGEITGIRGNSAIHVNTDNNNTKDPDSMCLEIGPHGYIHGNSGGYGTVTVQTSAGTIDVYGKIVDNTSNDHCGLCMANNWGTKTVTLHDGAEISRNYSSGGIAGVRVSLGTMVMEDGALVEGNISDSADDGAGIWVTNGGQFVMNGGSVSNNASAGIGGGVTLEASIINDDPYAQLNGGSVTGGAMNVTVTESNGSYSVSGGEANDLTIVGGSTFGKTDRYLSVANDVQLSEQSVFMDDYDFYIENPGSDVKLGNAFADCETYVTSALASQNLTQVRGSYWYETTAAAQSFDISDLSYDASKELYAAIVATDASGVPVADSAVTLRAVDVSAGGSLVLSLPGQNATGYAVVFVQEGDQPAQVVTVTPADITVYEGGDGYSAVVGDDGATATSNSMPHPMFKIEGVADAEGMTFSNAEAGKSWTVVSDGNGYYHFEPSAGQDDVRVTYTDASGNAVTSDEFDVAAVNETFAQYAIDLYLGQNNLGSITAQHEGQDYTVALGTGTLTVRAVEAEDPAAVTSSVATEAPSSPLASGTALAVEPSGGTTYTLNDTGVPLPDDATPSLLFDEIITSDGVDRVTALRNRVDEELGGADPARQYQMKYLDLVDSNNSNAWITSENGIDIYWAYPEGTDESTNFSLLHLKGLHRDGAQSGFDVTDVDSCDADNVTIEKTAQGIRFHVAAGDFSPYVLTWEQHTITATAGEGGSISPSGAVIVTDGADQAFTITANEGYVISDVKVDGVSVGAVNSYAFSDVTSDHAIEVTFAAETVTPPVHEHTWSDWKCDGTSHWRVCEECGAVKDRSEHVFGAWEQVGDGLWERSCTVCGYVQEGTTEPTEDEGTDKPTDESTDEELPQSGDSTNATLTGLLAVGGVVVAGSAMALRARRRNG